MVRLREIPRTAAFSWSAGASSPLLATGTKAGAVDVDFSNETCLELWDLALENEQQGAELQPAAKVPTDSGFHDLAWTSLDDSYSRGVIAGALDNGSLDLWDAGKLLNGSSNGLISRSSKHTGAIKALQFNPKYTNLVATGGAKGEIYITDLNQVDAPIRLGSTAARADDIDCLDWNKKVSHIMVTGSAGGFVTVWDMKTRKESLTLNNYGRKPVSAVAWDPDKPTKLVTAIPLEQEPLILVWDLRNSNAPERTLRGHDSGVLSLSWCAQDPDLLLSCGKDNRTIAWNPQTGVPYGDYPVVTNWTFQTRFNPHNPNLFATASFDGKIAIQTLQNTNADAPKTIQEPAQALDGEDFFSKATNQPQAAGFSLPKAPKWFERPVSVSFGFGGRIVSVKPESIADGKRTSKISITKFEVDADVGASADTFEKALQSGNLTNICESKIADAKTEDEKADWKVIETLTSSNPRKQLVEYLGFSSVDEAADGISKLGLEKDGKENEQKPQVNGTKGHKRLQSVFESGTDGDFLSDLAASKGARTNNPFQVYTGSESEADRRITRSLILGEFDKALDVCLEEERLSDAFMIAICGGQKCIQKAQEAYFSKQSGGPNYLRLLASVVGKNLWDVVHNADLGNWKEVMATLCTFADEKEFPDLCEALGDRLEEQAKSGAAGNQSEASFCYLAGSKLEKVVGIWLEELQKDEEIGLSEGADNTAFSLHARTLQQFIEKVTVFRKVTSFRDVEVKNTSDWKLDALYAKYVEYSDIAASHGQLETAQRYLDLVPTNYPEAEVARSRIQQATKKTVAPATRAQPATASRNKPLPSVNSFQPTPSPFAPAASSAPTPAQYATPAQHNNPYAPQASASQPANPYAPAGGYQPPQQMRGPSMVPPPPQHFGQAPGIAPPPRSYNQSPSIPPPSQAKVMTNWNDTPEEFARKPQSRRGTPATAPPPVASPLGQPPTPAGGPPPPVAPPYGARQRSTPPVPPPPKGPAPPPRVTSPLAGPPQGFQPPERPSSVANAYAPPSNLASPTTATGPQIGHSIIAPPVGRTQSPYNAPPSGPPPTNRYAPSPSAQMTGAQAPAPGPHGRPSIPPPPQASSFPSAPPQANPYAAARPQQSSTSSPYAPSTPALSQAQPAAVPPPPPAGPTQAGLPPSSRPGTAQSQSSRPPVRKHPAGDRSHIPTSSQPIYEILSSEMARVAGRAPASFQAQVRDTEKRLNILFDHLNNEDLLKSGTIQQMIELSEALRSKDFNTAQGLQMDIFTNKVDECGNWMVGVKRLIGMSRVTP
ncbi:putative protein transporter sec31 [Phaeomoniella chlamydospora]|uniref:Protein transport protein SEC31 n=1 Tax=Phaeomoniella chlamydospora TaxID=158046 RepID=A0A0G2EH27_PHACM|nr:putative protein transporter sec31 [Phaeomoniella chlamydospora]